MESFEIGGHCLVKDRFAVTVNFKDNTSQIFLGKIRPETFKKNQRRTRRAHRRHAHADAGTVSGLPPGGPVFSGCAARHRAI